MCSHALSCAVFVFFICVDTDAGPYELPRRVFLASAAYMLGASAVYHTTRQEGVTRLVYLFITTHFQRTPLACGHPLQACEPPSVRGHVLLRPEWCTSRCCVVAELAGRSCMALRSGPRRRVPRQRLRGVCVFIRGVAQSFERVRRRGRRMGRHQTALWQSSRWRQRAKFRRAITSRTHFASPYSWFSCMLSAG